VRYLNIATITGRNINNEISKNDTEGKYALLRRELLTEL
jgi:hypothetical protein